MILKTEAPEEIKLIIDELSLIKDETVLNLTITTLCNLPQSFWELSASSTGKFHPEYSQGKNGLLRHSKALVKIARELLRLDMFKEIAPLSDYIYSALLLHDGLKYGWGVDVTKTEVTHPILMQQFLVNIGKELNIDKNVYTLIGNLISSHMGQWNDGGILPLPNSKIQEFVHLCDYIGSRKCLEVNFNVEYIE